MGSRVPDGIAGALSEIFEHSVVIRVEPVAMDHGENMPQALRLPNVSTKRQREFAAGRIAARKALEAGGYTAIYPAMGESRNPIWPDRTVGSISQTDEFAVSAIAPADVLAGVGIDIEVQQLLDDSIARQVLTPREMRVLANDADRLDSLDILRAFSFKESIYKCVYPLVGMYIDFLEVELSFLDGSISASCARSDHPAADIMGQIHGDSRILGNHVVSACWLPNS